MKTKKFGTNSDIYFYYIGFIFIGASHGLRAATMERSGFTKFLKQFEARGIHGLRAATMERSGFLA